MKCKKCNKKNVSQANFCIKCGNKFTKSEQELAQKKGIINKLISIKEWYNNLLINRITSSKTYQIGSIVLVLALGIYYINVNGNSLKIMASDNYKVEYNTTNGYYYLYLKEDISNINLYSPKKVDNFYLNYYDSDNTLISTNNFNNINDIKVEIDTDNIYNYYTISTSNKEKDNNTVKLYVYKEVSEENE